jgi:hypothetical protein
LCDDANRGNLNTIAEGDEDDEKNGQEKLDTVAGSNENSFLDGMPQEIDQALVEKV